nr:hypothetical protein [Tanacetum cinerariifolium]
MVNVIPPDHVDEVPVVEPNQHDDLLLVPEPVLVDEDEDIEEDEFKEEEDPQEEEDDMEIDIEEDGMIRKDSDSLFPGLIRRDINYSFGRMAFISRRLCGRETTHTLVKNKRKEKDKFYSKLILELDNEVRSSMEQGTDIMEKLVEKLRNIKDKSAPMTQAAIRRMIKVSVNAAITSERARQANVRNDASGSGLTRGQDVTPVVREFTFVRFMKCNPIVFHRVEGAVELRRWFEKTESVFEISECAEGKKVKFAATTLEGLAFTWWKTKVATMGFETVNQMPWTEIKQLMTLEFCLIEKVQRMEHKLIAKSKEMRELWLPLLLTESFLYVNDVLLVMLASVRSSVTSMERLGIRQGHTRSRCPKKVKQEEVGEVRGQAYAIKDAEPQGPNVVAGASYEVELADGRVASTNTVLKGCTLNLVNRIFEIDLMPIEPSTFDVIIGMDCLVKHDAVIICIEKFVRIWHGNEMLIVESDKCVSRLKELPGLLPPRQVEFRIDLVLGAAPIVRAPYILAPSEMKELLDEEEHDKHLKIILELLIKERLYAKFSKCDFWLDSVQFLSHVIDRSGVHVDPAKIEAIKIWNAPTTPTEGKEEEIEAFQTLKQKLCSAPILALPKGTDYFVVYCETSLKGYGAVLMQQDKVIAHASRKLKVNEEYYTTYDLKLGVVIFALRLWRHYLYGTKCVVFTDHKILLEVGKDHYGFCEWIAENAKWEALGTNLDMSTAYHPQTDGQSERTIQMLEDMLRACVIDSGSSCNRHLPLVEFLYNNSYHASIKAALYEALYRRKCRSPVCLSEKSYVDKRLKPLEFKVGDMVLLKVSPWMSAVRFGKHDKLSPSYIRPFKILARVGLVAYTLELPKELKGIHSTFHVSNLKKCLAEDDVVVPIDEIQLDDKLHMIEEPVEVVDKEVKRLKQSRIPIFKYFGIRIEVQNLLRNMRIRLRRSTLVSLQLRTKRGKADMTSCVLGHYFLKEERM